MKRRLVLIPILIITLIIGISIFLVNNKDKYSKLSITQNKWNEIISTREENNNLKLESIEFNGYRLIIDNKNNSIYYSMVNESKNKFNPNVKYRTENNAEKIVVLADEITYEKIKEKHIFKIMIYNDSQYRIYNLVCTDFPVINIRYKTDDFELNKFNSMDIYVFNNLIHTPQRITVSNGKVKLDGENYIFKLNMTTPGNNIRDNKISILNMKPNSEYTLIKTGEDGQNGSNNNNEHKNNKVLLFINNENKGIYLLQHLK